MSRNKDKFALTNGNAWPIMELQLNRMLRLSGKPICFIDGNKSVFLVRNC